MRVQQINRSHQKFKEGGVFTVEDVIENVYTAWLSDRSHWINDEKSGYFYNREHTEQQRSAIFIWENMMKGFDFSGNLTCRRKYNPAYQRPLKRVTVQKKKPGCYYGSLR